MTDSLIIGADNEVILHFDLKLKMALPLTVLV